MNERNKIKNNKRKSDAVNLQIGPMKLQYLSGRRPTPVFSNKTIRPHYQIPSGPKIHNKIKLKNITKHRIDEIKIWKKVKANIKLLQCNNDDGKCKYIHQEWITSIGINLYRLYFPIIFFLGVVNNFHKPILKHVPFGHITHSEGLDW